MYARGFVRQGFNGVPEVVTVTDADRAATPSSITERANQLFSSREPRRSGW